MVILMINGDEPHGFSGFRGTPPRRSSELVGPHRVARQLNLLWVKLQDAKKTTDFEDLRIIF